MPQSKPQAIYIGLEQVGEVLQKLRPAWTFLPSVPDISKLWEGLSNGTINNNIQVMLILDQFFDPEGTDKAFEKLVAAMGPYCMLGIVNYSPTFKEQMKERIEFEAYATGNDTNLLYYFIDPAKPNPTIDAAINNYVTNPNSSEDVVSILTGRTSSEDRQKMIEEQEAEIEARFAKDDEPSPYLGQVVAVTSSKGGSGKSTVAVTLATYLAHSSESSVKDGTAEKPLKVLILDLDVRDGQLGFLTGNANPTVIQLRLNGISPETIENTVIHSSRLKCDLLLAPKRPRSSDDTPPEFYVELINTLRKMYDYVILDTSVNYMDPLLEKVAYPAADQIIFVTDIVVNSVFSMTRWIQEVTRERDQNGMGISPRKIGIVVNKSLADVGMGGDKISKSALGIPIITVIPSNPKLIAHSANIQSMEYILKHEDIRTAIRRLARGIVGKKYPLSDRVVI
jgi:MinD-like ATPase involved in chromosome partitioning or flagellar assembly